MGSLMGNQRKKSASYQHTLTEDACLFHLQQPANWQTKHTGEATVSQNRA